MPPKHITECIPPALKEGRAVSLAAPGVPELGACAPSSSSSVGHLVDANELQSFCYRLVYDVAPVSSSCPQFAGLSADMSDGLAALRVLFCFAKKTLGCGIGLVRHIDIRALEAFCSSFSIADASVLSDLDLPDFRLDDGSATLRVLARFAPQCRIAVAAPAPAAVAPATPYAPDTIFRAFDQLSRIYDVLTQGGDLWPFVDDLALLLDDADSQCMSVAACNQSLGLSHG